MLKGKNIEEIYLGEFIIDDKNDERLLKKYLIEKFVNNNDLYKPEGLKIIKN